LDDFTFIKAEKSHLEKVSRQTYGNTPQKSEEVPMLIMTNVVEMIVDKNGKILGVEIKKKFGLWLDALSGILKPTD